MGFTLPGNSALGAATNGKLVVTFTSDMDPATINGTTFTLKQGNTPVSGTVTLVGNSATFTPAGSLAPNATFTATITTGARNLAGNSLASNFVWSFTTGATADTTAPSANSTNPASGAVGVPINQKLAVPFSEAMDPSSLTTTTFTLSQGGNAVAGTVTYAGTTATFTPTANLAPNTTFTATLTTGVRDLAGNALANSLVWSFTTGATADTTAPALSTGGNATTPVSGATNVSASGRLTARFSEAMDPATINTTTFTLAGPGGAPVTGSVTYDLTNSTATFAPASILASGATFTVTITTGVKDLAGNALASNFTWTFTTAAPDTTAPTVSFIQPLNNASAAPINQKITASFNKALDPATLTNTTFTLSQGTTPVSGTVTYATTGNTATFAPSGNLAANATFTATLTSGIKDQAGNALANNFIWSFTTAATPDTTAPTVSTLAPTSGATAVPINQKLAVTFSEVMDAATLTNASFTLSQAGATVGGAVSYAGTTATFTPTGNLANGSPFTATVTGAKDLAGNTLATFSWSFTTAAAPDTTAPTVSTTNPTAGAPGVPINQKILVAFSEPMDASTLTTSTFFLNQGGNAVIGTVSYAGAGNTATFTPLNDLIPGGTSYTATVTNGAKDLAGNATAGLTLSFTTANAPDTTAPIITGFYPADNAINIGVKEGVTATFNETMDTLTLTTQTFTVRDGLNPIVVGSVNYVTSGSTVTFKSTADLKDNTTYTATVTAGAKDLAGNPVASKTWTFKTGQAAPDLGRGGAFAILATGTITGKTGTSVNGDVGLAPGSSITIAPSEIHGTIHINDQAVIDAQNDLNNAYNDANTKATNVILQATGELGNLTLTPGLYKAPGGTFAISSVDLTLDAQGNSNSVFIFQMATTLTVGNGREVKLINGAQAGNVYWQCGSSATLGTTTIFKGNILANVSISVDIGSALVGRLMAGVGTAGAGSVTFDSSTITVP